MTLATRADERPLPRRNETTCLPPRPLQAHVSRCIARWRRCLTQRLLYFINASQMRSIQHKGGAVRGKAKHKWPLDEIQPTLQDMPRQRPLHLSCQDRNGTRTPSRVAADQTSTRSTGGRRLSSFDDICSEARRYAANFLLTQFFTAASPILPRWPYLCTS